MGEKGWLPMFKLRAKVGAIVIGSAILCGTSIAMTTEAVTAAATPPGGLVKFWVTQSTNDEAGAIVITGAVGDYGTVATVNREGQPDQSGNWALVTLQKGTFMVNETSFDKKASKTSFPIKKTSCSSEGTAYGSVSLSDGTGHYTGISGHLSFSETDAWILARTGSGSTCSNDDVLHYFALQLERERYRSESSSASWDSSCRQRHGTYPHSR